MRVFAVPRSMARSLENMPQREFSTMRPPFVVEVETAEIRAGREAPAPPPSTRVVARTYPAFNNFGAFRRALARVRTSQPRSTHAARSGGRRARSRRSGGRVPHVEFPYV